LKRLWCDKTPLCFNNPQQQDEALFADDSGFVDFDLIKKMIKECKLSFLLVFITKAILMYDCFG